MKLISLQFSFLREISILKFWLLLPAIQFLLLPCLQYIIKVAKGHYWTLAQPLQVYFCGILF